MRVRRPASSCVVFVGAVYGTEGPGFESWRARSRKALLMRGFPFEGMGENG
jgi:hypothetical protein